MKTGKTTLASKFPKNLLIAFEKGYNAIDGIKAVDINSWSDFKLVLRQLKKPEAQAMYDTITIDTTTIAYDMCEQYICAQNGVQSIRDIAWGQGWGLAKKEFENCLRQITMLGYGLVLISHIETRKEKTADDSEIEILAPSMPKRCYEVVNQIVDIIGYIATEWDEAGNSERWLYTRQTPTVMAGSRFPYLAPKIKLGYNELVEAINDAIDMQREKDGATVVAGRVLAGAEADRDGLGRVDGRSAADGEQEVDAFRPAELDALEHERHARVGHHAVEVDERDAGSLEARVDAVEQPGGLHVVAAPVDEGARAAEAGDELAEAVLPAGLHHESGGHVEHEVVHKGLPFLSRCFFVRLWFHPTAWLHRRCDKIAATSKLAHSCS